MKQILFKLFENLKQLGIKPNIGSRTNVTPIRGSEIDRLINRPVTPKEFDYSKPEVVDSMRGIVQNASDYVGQFTERQLKTFNDNVERILGVIKPKEITAEVVDLATKEKITGPGLESLMREKGVPSISRKTIEAETLIKQFLDDDLISLNAKQIDQLSRGKAEDVFENIFGSKAKELITGKNTNESLNEVYNKLKTTKDTRGRLPDDPNFDPSDINFKDGGSVSEDVKKLLKEEFIELINADPESFPDTNAGFRRFLKRKGSPVFNYKDGGEVEKKEEQDISEKIGTLYKRKKEKKDGKLGPTDPLSKYESYSEEELAGNIEAKKPTFDTLEDYIMETMPIFEPKDVAPPKSYSPMPVEKYLTRRLFLDLAKGGRVKKRKRYADGGIEPNFVSRENLTYNAGIPSSKYLIDNGEKFFFNGTTFIPYGDSDIQPTYTGEIAKDPETGLPYDPSIGEPSFDNPNWKWNEGKYGYYHGGWDRVMSTGSSTPTTTEIPTVDPFSGQQVSAQDLIDINKEMSAKAPLGGFSEEGLRKNADDDAARLQSMMEALNSSFYNNTPTVDPFSGEQVSAQDQAAFGTTSGINFSSKYESLEYDPATNNYIKVIREGSNAGGNEAIDPIVSNFNTASGSKKIQDYLPNIGFNVPGHMDYFNKIREAGLPTSEYHRLGTADLVQRNIDQLPSILKPIAGAIAPVTALTMSIPYELTQASLRMEPGSGIGGFYNAYINESPFSAASNRFIGASQPLANQIQNLLSPTVSSAQRTVNVGSADPGIQALGRSIGSLDFSTMNALRNNADLLNTITGQTANMANGGRVSMSNGGLTKTIPPVRGPNPQGVESLFKRRYN
jgi:hypothetical protein